MAHGKKAPLLSQRRAKHIMAMPAFGREILDT
jgi:hypothetical protein